MQLLSGRGRLSKTPHPSYLVGIKWDKTGLCFRTSRVYMGREKRLVLAEGAGWSGRLELADVSCYIRMYKQQVPTVQHKELYSIFCDKR